jgi:hypothetical protein
MSDRQGINRSKRERQAAEDFIRQAKQKILDSTSGDAVESGEEAIQPTKEKQYDQDQ